MGGADKSSSPQKKARTTSGAGFEVVVYPGGEGSISHAAAKRVFENLPNTDMRGCPGLVAGFEAVAKGEAGFGVFPLESSCAGPWEETHELLLKHNVRICGEFGMREFFCLCAKREEVKLTTIKRVLSHPMIFKACTKFIDDKLNYEIDRIMTRSTTEAVKKITDGAAEENAHSACILTREIANKLGYHILADDIGNDAYIETRFITICSPHTSVSDRPFPLPSDPRPPIRKHTMCFALTNTPGACYKLFACFGMRNIDVIKVEARPMPHGELALSRPPTDANIWDSIFYIEYMVPFGQTKEAADNLQAALAEFSSWRHDLGTYTSLISRETAKQQPSFAQFTQTMAHTF